jgi:hypothetical protein
VYAIEDLLKLAETSYTALSSGNKWTGVKTKGKTSVFAASDQSQNKGGGKVTESICFNCGEKGLRLNDCSKPKNEQRIAAAKKKFQDAKKSSNSGTGTGGGSRQQGDSGKKFKWRQPESGEDNKRIIDGKHMWYNKGTKGWVLDKFHPSNKASQEGANVVQDSTGNGGNAAQPQQANNTSSNNSVDAAKSAAMANFTRTMETALNGLLNNFNN